jgi:hypothetical protein
VLPRVPKEKMLRSFINGSRPPWAGLGSRVYYSDTHGWVLDLHVYRPDLHPKGPRPLPLTFRPLVDRTHVFRPACALVSLSLLGLGSGATVWLIGARQEPSHGSKPVTR